MDTLNRIIELYSITLGRHNPTDIPDRNRNDLAQLFHTLEFKEGIEVGTEEGNYAEMLCQSNPSVHLTCVDPWLVYDGYRDYSKDWLRKKLTNAEFVARQRLAPYGVTFMKMFSMEAVNQFVDNSIDFVYIDANHEWPFVTQDIYYWAKKVRTGGIISGHDYYRSKARNSRCQVVSAVGGYTHAFFISPWFVLGAKGQERSRSWFWVKEPMA